MTHPSSYFSYHGAARVVQAGQWILDNIGEGKCEEEATDDVREGEKKYVTYLDVGLGFPRYYSAI